MNYSPSLHHQRLLAALTPELGWREGLDFATWQATLRSRLVELLGLDWQEGRRVPLAVRSLWRRDHQHGSIEKLVFTSEAQVDVPAYLCLPKSATPPHTCFICLQGHSTGMHNSIAVDRHDERRPITVEGDRDFGLGCLRHGLAALCVEQRSFGERREAIQGNQSEPAKASCLDAAAQALMLGRTLLGERVFDVDRAIDYLAGREDIDPERLGVMGNSGGGTTSLFAGALLPRLRFVMPSGYFCSFADSIMAMPHCICNYVPGLLKVAEMGDLAGLVAPRPLILVNGDQDGIFPIAGGRREFARLQNIYAAAGAPHACHHLVCQGGHRFYAEPAWKLFRERYS